MNFKRYTSLFLKIILIFSFFHFIIWNLYTKHIFDRASDEYVGDAGRMSYQVDSLFLRKNINTLPKTHINFNPKEKDVDVLTIGDSFSNGIVEGKNPYYQDYIASIHDLKVMNIENPNDNFFHTIIKLDKLGLLEEMNVKHIIIELVERSISSFSSEINFDIEPSKDYLEKINRPKFQRDYDHSMINRLNYNALLYNILYNFDERAYKSKIYKLKLNGNFFSVKNSNILLCYKSDIDNAKKINDNVVNKINDNFNNLQKYLSKKNIKLHFLPAVDKYNLYSKYIIDNKFNESIFFEKIRPLNKDYNFIDTKKILRKEIEKGEKDIFYSDDTHWSFKGSEAIAKSLELK